MTDLPNYIYAALISMCWIAVFRWLLAKDSKAMRPAYLQGTIGVATGITALLAWGAWKLFQGIN